MKKTLFIGIDFSKEKFDATLLDGAQGLILAHSEFPNHSKGFALFYKWIGKHSKVNKNGWLICGENTGFYSRKLSFYMLQKGCFMWLENPLQIKRSMGLVRGKTDKADSLRISEYAMRHQDKALLMKKPDKEIDDLKNLISFRDRLVKAKKLLQVPSEELRRVENRDTTTRFIRDCSNAEIFKIEKKIKLVEERILEIKDNQEDIATNYELVTSVKGVGMITAISLIIYTDNFSRFQEARQLACYCGCAPFPYSSGTMSAPNRVSHLANKTLKTLLTQCAHSAKSHDETMRAYYLKKIAEGKEKNVVINNIRNKLIHWIWAIVQNQQPYQKNYKTNWANIA